MSEIDPNSPIPLYHQIAQLIRTRIQRGELAAGDSLEPLRAAAREWDVNFHTVRHAYAELARDGLVELRGPLGTRVVGVRSTAEKPDSHTSDLERFLAEVRARAQTDFGLSATQLASKLTRDTSERPRPTVYALECSEHQCEDLARQIESRWDVRALPWCYEREGDLPGDHLVATHFHYNEVRLRWPDRLAKTCFVPIAPAPELRSEVERRLKGRKDFTLTLCERDQPTAEAVAADLSVVLPADALPFGVQVLEDPVKEIDAVKADLLLLPPRIWGSLSARQRDDDRLVEIRYVYDPRELREAARKLEWSAA